MTLPEIGFDFADREDKNIEKTKNIFAISLINNGIVGIHYLNSFERSSPRTEDAVSRPEKRALDTPTVVMSWAT